MTYVIYTVPDPDMTGSLVKITTKEAIRRQRVAGRQVRGYDPYVTDEAALQDFIDIHWAQVVEE